MFYSIKKAQTLTEISSASSGDSACAKPKAAGEVAGEEGVDIFTDSGGAVDSCELGLTDLTG